MITALEPLRQSLAQKSPILGALFSGGLGLAAEATNVASGWTNPIVVVALCGAAGAFFGSLPRIIAAMSGSRSVLHTEMRILLDRIHRLELRVVLEQDGKHLMQGEHNALVIHIMNMEALMVRANVQFTPARIRTYEELLGPLNKEIK